MKYVHNFKLKENDGNKMIFTSEDNIVRLDFFSHILRVAMYKENTQMFKTYSVCPGNSTMPLQGRDKLDTEGFEKIMPEITSNDGKISFSMDDVSIIIDLLNFRMHYYKNGKLLFEDREYISYNFENELGNGVTHFISREADEFIFGLGDKTGDVNKNKRSFKLAASDALGFDARSSDPLYKHLPFYICKNSVGSYGIYYDTYANGEFNFGKEINNYYEKFKSFRCEDDYLVYYVFFGDVTEINHQFKYMLGKDIFPPKWSLKYCGSTMSYTDAKDADHQLRNFISLCKKYRIDCGGFYMSSGYTQIGIKRYVFNWNYDKIPDPEDLSGYFKDNGVEFIPNIKPAFLTDHFLYRKIAEKGWFLHYKDKTPAVFPFWSGFGSYLDFTNPEAFEFWKDCVKKNLVDRGYKNIWNDNNEYDINDENVYAFGFGHEIKAKLIKPVFSYLMSLSSQLAQDSSVRYMSVSRAGCAGISRLVSTWTGDNNTSFEDFRYNHKMAMTMVLSGIYNFGQDIGGFAGPCPNKELFIRWLQYGVFTPRFTLHSWNPDGSSTMPWLYKDEMDTVRKIFDLRTYLLPYLYDLLYKSVNEYKPIIYPLFFKYKDYDVESDYFMVGDNILSCPVFDKGKDTLDILLPENNGNWYFNKENYKGKVTLKCTLKDTPVYFVKGGSVLPHDDCFEIYASENENFSYEFFEDDGISNLSDKKYSITRIDVSCNEKEVIVTSSSDRNFVLTDYKNRKLTVKKV